MTDAHMKRDADTELIKTVVAGVEAAFNKHDIDELDSYFTSNSVRVNAYGRKLTGFAKVGEDNKNILKGFLRDSYARYEVANILFVRPDMAVVHIDQETTNAEGTLVTNGQRSIAMYVMVKEHNDWRIIASQNTLIKKKDTEN